MKSLFPTHPKLRGEWAEWQFIARALALGFRVAKPLGDCCRYDVVIDNPTGFHRVQIKSTIVREHGSYRCVCYSSAGYHSYSPHDFDFFAAYVIPEDVWFIIPASAIAASTLTLDPNLRHPRNRYRPYREAWHLLRRPSLLTIHASADPLSDCPITRFSNDSIGSAPALVWFDPTVPPWIDVKGGPS